MATPARAPELSEAERSRLRELGLAVIRTEANAVSGRPDLTSPAPVN